MVQPLWKTVWQFLTKLNILLPYNAAIVLHVIYWKKLETYIHNQNLHMDVVFSIIVKTWKQPVCLSVGEWINKLWHIQTIK